jgi:methyl-accepting chemotaxis protein
MSEDGGPLNIIRKRYARKFAIIGFVIILLVSGIAIVTQAQISDRIQQEKFSTVETNTNLEAKSMGSWLDGQKRQVRTLSNHRNLQTTDNNQIRIGLRGELNRMPGEVAALHYVFIEDRTVTVSTTSSYTGQSLSDTGIVWNTDNQFPQERLANDSRVVESLVYREGDEPSVALASSVPESNSMVVAVIGTNQRAQGFESAVEGTRTTIVGAQTGEVLFAENKEEVLTSYGGEGNNTELERRVVDEGSSSGQFTTSENVVSYRSVPGTDWVVVKEAPKSNALALKNDIRRSLGLLIGGAILGLVVLNLVTALGPMRSLRRIAKEGQAIAAGDLSVEIADDNRVDEVGQVRSSFRNIKSYIDTAAAQSDAIAKQEFDADVLEEEVPGPLGESLQGTRDDLETSINEMESARKQAEVARAEAEQLADYLKEQAQAYSETMQNVGAGDLTQRMEADGQEESMDRIAQEFNDMIVELEKTTGQLQSYVDEVEQAGEEVGNSADTVKEASEQVAESIQKISDDAYGQKDHIEDIEELVETVLDDLEATTESDASTTEQIETIREISGNLNDLGAFTDEMMTEAEQVAGAAEEQAAELNQVQKQAEDLQRYAEPLRDILERFETDQEHEFVFSVGPTGGNASPGENN